MLKVNINSLSSQIGTHKEVLVNKFNNYTKQVFKKTNLQEDVVEFTKDVTKKKDAFMSSMLHKYERVNFYKKAEEKEDLSYINNIYTYVKNPHKEHFRLVEHLGDSFKILERIFVASNNKKEALRFAIDIQKQVLNQNKNARKELVPELLESPYHKKYVKNFDRIKSYLILNNDNPNAVKWLDNMTSRNIFSKEHFDKKLQKEKIKKLYPFNTSTKILNPNTFCSIYSEPAENLMNKLCVNFYISPETLKNGNDKDVFNILKTTTSKNLNIRKFIMNSYIQSYKDNSSMVTNENISELNKLYNIIDKNEDAKSFVKKSINNSNKISIKELNNVLTTMFFNT